MSESLLERWLASILAEYEARPRRWADSAAGRTLVDVLACASAAVPPGESSDVIPVSALGASGVPLPDGVGVGAAQLALRAHRHDRDDVHWPSLTHPGGVVWPAVTSVGAQVGAAGTDAVRAAAIGYEVTARLAELLGASHRRYWHATTTCGPVGASVAVALLTDDGPTLATDAASHALSVAGGSIRTILEHSGTRLFHRAHAVRTAIGAAEAALSELRGTERILEGPRGILAANSVEVDVGEELLRCRDLWAVTTTSLRLYASNGFAHGAIEAGAGLGPLTVEDVDRAVVRMPGWLIPLVGDVAPRSDIEAWWSLPFALSVALLEGDPWALEGPAGYLEAPELDALLKRIDIQEAEDPTTPLEVSVLVTGSSGEREVTVAAPLGHPSRPLPDDVLVEKWHHLTGLDRRSARSLVDLADGMSDRPLRETLGEIRDLLAGVSRRGIPR